MPRKLKAYQTSLGFFDLAVAVPSMKAALEAWAANGNLFHQGFAREIVDRDVVAATLQQPGVVLKRPVGSSGPFTEHAELPDVRPPASIKPSKVEQQPAKTNPARKTDERAARDAALAFEKQEKQRDNERCRAEAAEEKQRQRRDRAVETAQAAFDAAERAHDEKVGHIDDERRALDIRSLDENTRWTEQRKRLLAALARTKALF